jgi:hypothetical protein
MVMVMVMVMVLVIVASVDDPGIATPKACVYSGPRPIIPLVLMIF